MRDLGGKESLRLFDNKFVLTDTASHTRYNLRVDVQFVDSGEHYTVTLHAGPDGSSNRINWYTGNYDETLAHELGHQPGLKDEYIDATAPDRATATSPGVHTDHSIMGNYLARVARMPPRRSATAGRSATRSVERPAIPSQSRGGHDAAAGRMARARARACASRGVLRASETADRPPHGGPRDG